MPIGNRKAKNAASEAKTELREAIRFAVGARDRLQLLVELVHPDTFAESRAGMVQAAILVMEDVIECLTNEIEAYDNAEED